MHYEIASALKATTKGKLTTAQRTSSSFQECPVVAGKQLRRGVKIKLSEDEFKRNRIRIQKLKDAGAIVVSEVLLKSDKKEAKVGGVAEESIKEPVNNAHPEPTPEPDPLPNVEATPEPVSSEPAPVTAQTTEEAEFQKLLAEEEAAKTEAPTAAEEQPKKGKKGKKTE